MKTRTTRCARWGCKNASTRLLPVVQKGTTYVAGASYPWYPFCDEHTADDLTKAQR